MPAPAKALRHAHISCGRGGGHGILANLSTHRADGPELPIWRRESNACCWTMRGRRRVHRREWRGPGRPPSQAISRKIAKMRKTLAWPDLNAIGRRSASTAQALELGASDSPHVA